MNVGIARRYPNILQRDSKEELRPNGDQDEGNKISGHLNKKQKKEADGKQCQEQ